MTFNLNTGMTPKAFKPPHCHVSNCANKIKRLLELQPQLHAFWQRCVMARGALGAVALH